ncbi:hypothetical protein [Glaciecola sp. SC05]|uniref:hypothetical protein n=1 Tax=Glaciecola sp. SC05 TaxID=1987355 RepID=UPI0035282540
MLTNIRRYFIKSRFKRHDLKIIEGISFSSTKAILDTYVSEGWELGYQFSSAGSLASQGECIVRRGQSSLTFAHSETSQGSITGPTRIINDIAKQYKLPVLPFPS